MRHQVPPQDHTVFVLQHCTAHISKANKVQIYAVLFSCGEFIKEGDSIISASPPKQHTFMFK